VVVSINFTTVGEWIAWAGLVLPFLALAWSALNWIKIERDKAGQRNFENFYDIILRIHNRDQAAISQTAAVYQLRNYPEYKDFILNFCDNRQSFFNEPIPPALDAEIQRTADYFRKN
jgi:hypothetical protein